VPRRPSLRVARTNGHNSNARTWSLGVNPGQPAQSDMKPISSKITRVVAKSDIQAASRDRQSGSLSLFPRQGCNLRRIAEGPMFTAISGLRSYTSPDTTGGILYECKSQPLFCQAHVFIQTNEKAYAHPSHLPLPASFASPIRFVFRQVFDPWWRGARSLEEFHDIFQGISDGCNEVNEIRQVLDPWWCGGASEELAWEEEFHDISGDF
jgi:hypothetical protein